MAGIRAPHKIKGGVSGCIREYGEAQGEDFGLIATDKGFNIYVCGNGGSKPRHGDLLIGDCPPDDVIPILDRSFLFNRANTRFLMFYIRTGDRLQRTARWIESMESGLKHLTQVILEDKLGICDDLERQMSELVGTWYDEWEVAIKDPVKTRPIQTIRKH
jgi:nitrite reductase (NAD(P)H)